MITKDEPASTAGVRKTPSVSTVPELRRPQPQLRSLGRFLSAKVVCMYIERVCSSPSSWPLRKSARKHANLSDPADLDSPSDEPLRLRLHGYLGLICQPLSLGLSLARIWPESMSTVDGAVDGARFP